MDGLRRALAALTCALAGAAPLVASAQTGAAVLRVGPEVRQFVATVLGTGDNEGRPFAVVDKRRARIAVFDAAGRLLAASPVLLGQARGDRSAPDVGAHTQTGHVPFAERTTPAGRFVAEPGRNLHGEPIVWLDYDAALAIHRVRPGASRALRTASLASPTPDDNRRSLGCVVVPVRFYLGVIGKILGQQRSVVYVLPEHGAPADLLARSAAQADTARLRLTPTDHPG